jgi:hypothetical protein
VFLTRMSTALCSLSLKEPIRLGEFRAEEMERAFYSSSILSFLDSTAEEVLKTLAASSVFEGFPANDAQVSAWREEVDLLRGWLIGRGGSIYLEYTIPRMGRRVDAILVLGPAIIVIEFKVGEPASPRAAVNQVWDYALDLKNFHEPSHSAAIFPVLVPTMSQRAPSLFPTDSREDGVWDPIECSPDGFSGMLESILAMVSRPSIDRVTWEAGRYSPTPTIIEAALRLYNSHSVDTISRSDAGATNLTQTSKSIEEIIRLSRSRAEKSICLVTGVPGSGKTLVGLNVATKHMDKSSDLHAVYLSGNGPLVAVLSEALARDSAHRLREHDQKPTLRGCRSTVKAFIQNVHNFRDESTRDLNPPFEHVAIFDEAQRAWDRNQTSNFMHRRKGISDCDRSEPDYLLSYMDRHPDWCVVVCLVGEGQEINTGEAGMSEWVTTLARSFPAWKIYTSDRLVGPDSDVGPALRDLRARGVVTLRHDLHLSTSLRSFRAENVATLVQSLLRLDVAAARQARSRALLYPIVLTRRLALAKSWIRQKARSSERFGLVVSSSAERLKPHAIDVRSPVNPVHWFLDEMDDTRSSCFLEDAATEFQVQGLELDWTCVVWDADLRFNEHAWGHWEFAGTQWNQVRKARRKQYLENAYRVLLTRARQGMAIVVPEGDSADATRLPEFYDSTYLYLKGIGIPELDNA